MIENGTIVSYLSTAEVVVDGLGCVLLPGFINSHCHPENVSDLEDLASYGVSTGLAIACYDYDTCYSLRNQTSSV
jgi:hypothetical protein